MRHFQEAPEALTHPGVIDTPKVFAVESKIGKGDETFAKVQCKFPGKLRNARQLHGSFSRWEGSHYSMCNPSPLFCFDQGAPNIYALQFLRQSSIKSFHHLLSIREKFRRSNHGFVVGSSINPDTTTNHEIQKSVQQD